MNKQINLQNKVRVRFAPSPTGYLHIGSLRSALYNYLFYKKYGGEFVLRIEDTDQKRFVNGAIENIIKTLSWAGISYDEGVFLDKEGKFFQKGEYGPYIQSKRLEIYKKYAIKLVEEGEAYYCFCSENRLKELRAKQQKLKSSVGYDRHCRKLSHNEVAKKLDDRVKCVIRLKVPETGKTKFRDIIRGDITVQNKEIDDQVLLKSDGFPTYHLANVVDDYLMKITYIIRGEEWLPSVPKHILIYQAFGWEVPQFAHLPLLLNPDKTKLSKRDGDVAVEDYIRNGYLKEAIINFVALLGWNPRGDQEIYSLKELIENFDLKKVNKSGAIFNIKKLNWLNSHYLKTIDPLESGLLDAIRNGYKQITDIYPLAAKLISSKRALNLICELFQERLERLNQVQELILENIYFVKQPEISNPEILLWKDTNTQKIRKNLEDLKEFLSNIDCTDWTRDKLKVLLKDYIQKNHLTNGEVLWPMRVALTGLEKSPDPFTVSEILEEIKHGEVLSRLKKSIEKLS